MRGRRTDTTYRWDTAACQPQTLYISCLLLSLAPLHVPRSILQQQERSLFHTRQVHIMPSLCSDLTLEYSDLRESSSSSTSSMFSDCEMTSVSGSFTSTLTHQSYGTSKSTLWTLAENRVMGVAELNRLRELGATEAELLATATAISRSRPECCQTFREIPC